MDLRDKELLVHCIQRRESGRHFEAVNDLSMLFKKYPSNNAVINEIIKLYVLLGEFERAHHFYVELQRITNCKPVIEPECLLRLQSGLKTVQLPDLDKIDLENCAQWCRDFMKTGEDNFSVLDINDVSVICSYGPINYTITATCGSCNHKINIELNRTFLVRREMLCPVCFARHLLEYEAIKKFLQKHYKDFLNEEAHHLDAELRKMQYKLNLDAMHGDSFSKISRYLNQDYIFILNQFLTTRLMEQK